jgi:hypothetical protein
MSSQAGSVRLVAVAALVSGGFSAVVVALPGRGYIGGGFAPDQTTIYGPAHAALALALASAGLLLVVSSRREPMAALLGVIGLCSAQLAGVGLVGYRRWPLYWGCCSIKYVTHQELVRNLAVAMAVVCAVTAVASLLVLVSQRFLAWQGWAAAVAFPVALVVAVAVPGIMAGDPYDERDLVAAALTYSVPFGAALAVSGLMVRPAALVVAATVAGSALIATVGSPFLETVLPFRAAQALAVGSAGLVAVARLVPRRSPAGDEA